MMKVARPNSLSRRGAPNRGGSMDVRVIDYIIGFAGFLATWVFHTVGANHAKLRAEHDALRESHNEARVAFGRLEAQMEHTRETLHEVLASVRRLESRL